MGSETAGLLVFVVLVAAMLATAIRSVIRPVKLPPAPPGNGAGPGSPSR